MQDYHSKYPGREMIIGWVACDGYVKQVQGFYCTNGPDIDGEWNITNEKGDAAPGHRNNCPMYFAPEIGYSMDQSRYRLSYTLAADECRTKLLAERAIIDGQLAALDAA